MKRTLLPQKKSTKREIASRNTVNTTKIKSGRTRLSVDFGLILDLRENGNLGWSRVAREYIKRTGQYISKQTCKRRYEEVRVES